MTVKLSELASRLEETEARSRAIVDTAVDGIVTIDQSGIIQSFNRAAEKIFGFSSKEVIGTNISRLMPEPDSHNHDAYMQRYLQTGKGKIINVGREVNGLRKDGSIFPMDLAVSEMAVADRHIFTGIIRDITERKAASAELETAYGELERAHQYLADEQTKRIQTEKLSSIGLLAAGVAHEINNPLAGVMACIKALRQEKLQGEKRDEYYNVALEGLERIRGAVGHLLDLSRQVSAKRIHVSLESLLHSAIRICTPLLKRKSISVQHNMSEPLLQVCVNKGEITNALINILLNAVYACPAQGNIEVNQMIENERVGLLFHDNGPGFADKNLNKVCEPFFTTKPEGEGTGLGLTVTNTIVRAHGGEIEIQNHSDGGASVTLWLPQGKDIQDV
jgi:two-component system sensor kinase FixL